MIDYLKKDPSLLYISLCVISFHILSCFFVLKNHTAITQKKAPLFIKTVSLQEKVLLEKSPTSKEEHSSSVKKKTKILEKEPIKQKEKPLIKKKQGAAIKKTPQKEVQKKEGKKKNTELQWKPFLSKAEESLRKVDNKEKGSFHPRDAQEKIFVGALKADTFTGTLSLQESYHDKLIYTLKKNLKLPEQGDVDLWLTLSKEGSVLLLKIEGSQSVVNRVYIERELPKIQFPPLSGEEKTEFPLFITLTND